MENAGTDVGELADWFQSQREHKATSAKLWWQQNFRLRTEKEKLLLSCHKTLNKPT